MTTSAKSSNKKAPTQDELCGMIDKGLGQLMKEDDISKRKKAGELPENFKLEEGFGVYRLEVAGEEYLCVTNILCDQCQRINGKVKRCPQHKKKKKRSTKKKANGEIEDDASDREKLGALRHIEDDEEDEDKIDGAITPYAVLTPGIGGAIIMVTVNSKGNDKAGPPAKNMHHVKGILVRGAGNIPQFIPNDKMSKMHKLRFDNYIEGELIMAADKAVFVPNSLGAAKMDEKNLQQIAKASVADRVDTKLQEAVGKDVVVAVQVDVADNGLPVMRIIREKPKNRETPTGVVLKVNDQVQFVQVGGKELGGGPDAVIISTTPGDNIKQGDVIADVAVNQEGRAVAYKTGEAPKDAKVIGKIVAGINQEPVFVANGQKIEDAIKNQEKTITPEIQEKLEKAQIDVQVKITGQDAQHISNQVERIGAVSNLNNQNAPGQGVDNQGPAAGPPEARSVGFGAQQFGGSCFAKAAPAGKSAGGGGGGGAYSGGSGGNGGAASNNNGAYQYGSGGEVKSVGFGAANGFGGSVFATAAPRSSGNQSGGNQRGSGSNYSNANAGGAAGKQGAAGASNSNNGPYQYGNAGEVKSVGFGAANGSGGSVFATAGGRGGASQSGGASSYGKSGNNTGGAGGKTAGGAASNNNGGYQYGSGGEVKSVGFGAANGSGGSVFATAGNRGGASQMGGYQGGGGTYNNNNNAGGAGGKAGGSGGASAMNNVNNTGFHYGNSGEVKSVGFGAANGFGGSVFATAPGRGGGGGGGASQGGGGKSSVGNAPNNKSNYKPAQPTGITRGSQGEVKSTFLK